MDSTGTRTYLRDGAYVTDPVLSDGAATYTPGISERRSGTTKFYHPDRLGTTERLTDTSQNTTDTRHYDAFGLLTSSSGSTPTPFGFAIAWGYQEDPDSGLKLLGHRYYDPSTGRFLTRDPIKDGRNWYGYCGNAPISLADPTGTIAWVPIIIAIIVIIDIIDTANDIKDIIEDPTDPCRYISPALGVIDPTPGNVGKRIVKRFQPKKLRKLWEGANDATWPKTEAGRNYDVSHKKARADGGDDSLDNIEPLPHDEHMRRHIESGDFKRWGGRRYP